MLINQKTSLTQRISEFKQKDTFRYLRDLHSNYEDLELRTNTENENGEQEEEAETKIRFDFDSENGYELCKGILRLIEKLFKSYNLRMCERGYREKFTKAYKMLY